jgi:hypothetical protein
MQKLLPATLAGLAIAITACSKEEARDVGQDARAAAAKVGDEAKDAANSPELKEFGSEVKEAAKDTGQVIKEAAKGAAEGAREGAAKVEAEGKSRDRLPDDDGPAK